MKNNVLVVGSINVDYVIHTERLPKLGETIVGDSFSMNFGGKGANQAIAIAKSGCNVKMLGAVGNDQAGGMAIQNLERFGVDTSSVLRVDAPTGAVVITVCGGDNHIIPPLRETALSAVFALLSVRKNPLMMRSIMPARYLRLRLAEQEPASPFRPLTKWYILSKRTTC